MRTVPEYIKIVTSIDSVDTYLVPAGLNDRQRQRLADERHGLEAEWDLSSQQVKWMRAALAIDAGIAARFQLEQELLQEEAKLASLDARIDEIKRILL